MKQRNFKELLQPIDGNKKYWRRWVCWSLFLLIVVVGLKHAVFETSIWEIIFSIFIPLLTVVLGACLLNIIYNKAEGKKIQAISDVSYDDLLPNLLDSLSAIGGKYRKDEIIHIKIEKYPPHVTMKNDLYKLEIDYQYKTMFKNQSYDYIEFMFKRLFNQQNINEFTGGKNRALLKYDFYWGMDESGFPQNSVTDADYVLSQLMIDNTAIPNADLNRHVETGNSKDYQTINYYVPLENLDAFDRSKEYALSYTITMPIEKESIILITHELPTCGGEVTFDYATLENEISVYGLPMTGLERPTSPYNSAGVPKIKYRYTNWILPKQGYVFSWWEK